MPQPEWASSSGHWYRIDGSPCYTVPAKKGGERPTTIRDARILGLVPSVTTIIRCAAAPGLERWKAEQLLLAALTMPRVEGETEKDWRARVQRDSQEQARAAADRGTEIHAAIEAHYRGEPCANGWQPWVEHVTEGIAAWFGPQTWGTERSFAHPLGYGGKVDIHSPAVLLDIKSKDGDLAGEKLWDTHFMQLAAYGRGLRLPDDARYGILFVSRTHPEAVRLLEADPTEVERGWRMFQSLLQFWQAKNGFV